MIVGKRTHETTPQRLEALFINNGTLTPGAYLSSRLYKEIVNSWICSAQLMTMTAKRFQTEIRRMRVPCKYDSIQYVSKHSSKSTELLPTIIAIRSVWFAQKFVKFTFFEIRRKCICFFLSHGVFAFCHLGLFMNSCNSLLLC